MISFEIQAALFAIGCYFTGWFGRGFVEFREKQKQHKKELAFCTRGDPAQTVEEVSAIVLAEFDYWKDSNTVPAIGAVGAAANILAAIHGARAPWHPKQKATHNDTDSTASASP